MEYALPLVDVLAWPVTVLLLVIIFRSEIISLIRRLKSADLSSRVLQFGESPIDRGELPKLQQRQRKKVKASQSAKVNWDKPATLFWLANDLMWIQDILLRGGPRDKFIAGLTHAREYAITLGLSGTFAVDELTRIIEYFEPEHGGLPNPLFLDQVPEWVNQIELVKRDVASRVEQSQPGFTKFRVF